MWHSALPRYFGFRCVAVCLLSLGWRVSPAIGAEGPFDDFVAQTWTTQDELPHNRINQIVQDRDGFLWVATHAGLTRFDGREFKDFPLPVASKSVDGTIRNVVEEGGGALAVIPSSDEVFSLEKGAFRLHPIASATANQVPVDSFSEPDGTLWVGTLEGRLYRWKSGDLQVFGPEAGLDSQKPSFSFARDREGRTWVATGSYLGYYKDRRLIKFEEPLPRMVTIAPARSGGVWVLAGGALKKLEDGKLKTLFSDPPWIRLGVSVRRLHEDRKGCLWLAATNNGIFWLRDGKLVHAPLPYPNVLAMLEDREGNMWLGTKAEGLVILRPRRFRSFDATIGMPQKVSFSVCEDDLGDIWFANGSGGLVRKRGTQLERIPLGPSPQQVLAVCPDGRGHILVGTETGLYRVSQEDPAVWDRVHQPMGFVALIFVARNGDIWLGGIGGGLALMRGGNFQFLNYATKKTSVISAIAEDPQGTIWLGSTFEGLMQFKDGAIRRVKAPDSDLANKTSCLYVDHVGSLWLGTPNGLLLWDKGRFRRFSETEGLWDHIILQIQEDEQGRLWLGSRKGYFHVSRQELEMVKAGRLRRVRSVIFGRDEGVPGGLPMTGSQPVSLMDRTGQLWFATQQGVIAVDPKTMPRSVEPVFAFIDEVRVDDRRVEAGTEIQIPPGRHRLEFRFSAPSFTSPDNVSVRYQLEGIDPEWVETEPGRVVSYPSLSAGRYRLKAIACDGNGVWNDRPAILDVEIVPAWWQREWIRAAGALLALGGFVWLVRFVSQAKLRRRLARIERERALEKERTRIARDVHDDLGSSLTSVRLLVSRLKSDLPVASQGSLLEQVKRQTQQLAFDLERVVWTVHPKGHSLDQLVAFIGRFAQNLLQGSSIFCEIRRDDDIPPHAVTPETQHHILAVVKETLNNALKHSHADRVVIESAYRDAIFMLTIRDDGSGFDPQAEEHSERNGLSNMRSRTQEMDGQIEVLSAAETGTEIRLRIPLIASKVTTKPSWFFRYEFPLHLRRDR